jgi:hypothetical protein
MAHGRHLRGRQTRRPATKAAERNHPSPSTPSGTSSSSPSLRCARRTNFHQFYLELAVVLSKTTASPSARTDNLRASPHAVFRSSEVECLLIVGCSVFVAVVASSFGFWTEKFGLT